MMPSLSLLLAVLAVAPLLCSEAPARVIAATSLNDLVSHALSHHPGLYAPQAEIERQRARLPQLTALPEPRLSMTPLGDLAETAAGTVTATISLSQQFPALGSLDALAAKGQAAIAQAESSSRQRQLSVAVQVRQAWWHQHRATATLALLHQQAQLITELHEVITRRVEANLARGSDLLRIEVERERLNALQAH
ncbi:MAG: TolC family protein, partial [Planctomycetota bacterium]